MAVVYGSLIVPVALRRVIGDRVTPLRVGFCSVSSSVAFFLTTNFAVWLFGGFYPQTVAGLIACFAAGLSFFR